MKHLGDICKISGYTAPIVDVITGGSPCQDLSVAGKRAGLAGERSGLFMEQMRIVKEMRERDRANGRTGWMVRPRYMVWENVPGAFSSGNPKGADFAAVIEEIIKVAEPGASVSVCVPNGGWTKSGCYYAEDGSWSIAWRVHDAQFWGVPQRRKRISLVADFGGLSASEILFERKGLSGDSEQSRTAREETAGAAGGGVEGASWGIDHVITTGGNCTAQGPCVYEEVEATLKAAGPHAVFSAISFQERGGKPGGGKEILIQHEHVGALSTLNNQSVLAYGIDQQAVMCFQNTGRGWWNESDVGATLRTPCGGDSTKANLVAAVDCRNGVENGEINGTLQAKEQGQNLNSNNVCRCGSVVRRLTPLECERLQGYPDGWTDIGEWVDSKGKKHGEADSPRYKALGNSIALPFWAWLARRICAQYERTVTMASLFDGIGGFPLVFSRCGATPVWASEIEEFPIAVTKVRFPNESV